MIITVNITTKSKISTNSDNMVNLKKITSLSLIISPPFFNLKIIERVKRTLKLSNP